ncbi:MAG: zeta toxin family protein [Pseudomonadota bacterium]
MSEKQLWLLTGGNGAGKSTFFRLFLEHRGLVFINADQIAQNIDPENPEAHSYEAATAAMTLFKKYVNEGRTFCYETVFSHPSKVEFIGQAKASGYQVILVYIHLEDDLHELRVLQRVTEGGHDVPQEKIRSRRVRTLRQVREVSAVVDELLLFDNSSAEQPFVPILHRNGSELRVFMEPLPNWASTVLSKL